MNSPITRSSSPPKFPSFEEYYERDEVVLLTDFGFRIKWSLSAPLISMPSPISVMPHGYITNDPAEPYYWGPSAITRTTNRWIGPLNEWEQNWVDLHDDHSYQPPGEKSDDEDDDDDENAEPQEAPNPFYDDHGAKYGPLLPDHDLDDPNDDWPECNGRGSGQLIECCGGKRPRRTISKYTICIKAGSKEDNGGFVTIHDLIEQVHPRLMEWRADILEARAVKRALSAEGPEVFTREEALKWGREEELFVSVKGLVQITIRDRVEWTKMYTRREDRIAGLNQGS